MLKEKDFKTKSWDKFIGWFPEINKILRDHLNVVRIDITVLSRVDGKTTTFSYID
jgi:hypothetical protein